MNRRFAILSVAAMIALGGLTLTGKSASATVFDCDCCACVGPACDNRCCECGYMLPVKRSCWYNWNRNYAHTEYGQPVALVVPPTANLQTNWGWGVASSRVSRIEHQFQRNFPGYGQFGGPHRPTPVWPSDTSQFGVYHVRGPW